MVTPGHGEGRSLCHEMCHAVTLLVVYSFVSPLEAYGGQDPCLILLSALNSKPGTEWACLLNECMNE